jgi:hypothetical protein
MVTRQQGHRPLIEVLYVRDCPHYAGALALVERVRDALLAAGRSDATTDPSSSPQPASVLGPLDR